MAILDDTILPSWNTQAALGSNNCDSHIVGVYTLTECRLSPLAAALLRVPMNAIIFLVLIFRSCCHHEKRQKSPAQKPKPKPHLKLSCVANRENYQLSKMY